jgi:hypothetical protein
VVANVGTATLHGYAYGGQGGDIGGSGGVGFDIQANGSGFNWGRIFGGQGGGPIGGQGGAGVTLEGVYFHNRFIVRGGAGDSGTAGDPGGEVVDASAGKVVNDGAIYGGAGSDSVSYDPHNRGGGGTGVSLTGSNSQAVVSPKSHGRREIGWDRRI